MRRRMVRPARRPRRRSVSAAATAAALLLTSSPSARSSALLAPTTSFVRFPSRPCRRRVKGELGWATSLAGSTRPCRPWPRERGWSPLRNRGYVRWEIFRLTARHSDGEDRGIEDDDEKEVEEDLDDLESDLRKISWLPSVKLGKQPYKPPFGISRRESVDGEGYENLEGNGSNAPPGYQSIEILPVLPMTMVHGLEGMFLDHAEEEPLDGWTEGHGAAGVWAEDAASVATSTFGPMFSGTSSYLPHTKGVVFTVAEPRYKKLYDDLLRVGTYYGMKRERALRREREEAEGASEREGGAGTPSSKAASLPDPDEKRRFVVTAASPAEDGVFAEYGLLFQLKDLDEVAAVASYEGGGEGMAPDELRELIESMGSGEYDSMDSEDAMDILLSTHYEATHDVVGRVKINRFVNPESYGEGPEGDEYLMAETTILDVVDNDRAKFLEQRAATKTETTLAATRAIEERAKEQAIGEVADAVSRIKDELRSSLSEAFEQQKQLDPESIKSKLRAALEQAPSLGPGASDSEPSTGPKAIPLAPKGVLVERRSDESLSREERALRESFAKLVALQHEMGEECRFTRTSVRTFGIGPVGVWLSASAWSQFVEKRLEAAHGDMQGDLQAKLVDYLVDGGGGAGGRSGYLSAKFTEDDEDGVEGAETVDFDDLTPDLQREFQLVQARASEELGPLALDRAIQMQRIVQAESYTDRLLLLTECVDNERRRLEAKKLLKSLSLSEERQEGDGLNSGFMSRDEARSVFEKLMSEDGQSKDHDEEAFQ
ncbi:hypothetical protein ACHAWF_005646 [Thalassiosira exigua]